jgi:TRAP transporter 4TM/12TM fusion protein
MLKDIESGLRSDSKEKSKLWLLIAAVALAMTANQLLANFVILQATNRQLNTHLGFALILTFLIALQKKGKYRLVALLFLLASVFSISYLYILEPELVMRIGRPNTLDIIVGILIIIAAYEASRLAFGPVLPIVGILFLAYTFGGHFLPGILYHPAIALDRGLTFMVLGFDGLYGTALFTSMTIVFYFIVFGSLLQATGAGEFFIEVGKIVGRKVRSGPALTSVLSSSMVASITGTPAPNIILTGSFTIPLMKKVGFEPEVAGAVEAVASTGGQIMPPVMGAAAFLMANIIGIPYANIMVAAIIPALLYYVPLGLGVQLYAMRHHISGFLGQEVDYRLILRSSPLFVIPFIIIIYLLLAGFSPMYAASWAILGCLSLSLGSFLLSPRPQNSPLTFSQFWAWCMKIGKGLITGAILAAQISAVCALLGVAINAIALTGMDIKLCGAVNAWAGGNLILALLITALISLILGCGLPSIAAYLIVAIAVCPILTSMGVPLLQAHFFVFWCAIMGWLTPPVATAPLIAGKLAGAGFLKTCWQSIILAAPGWFIPFMFVLTPSLLGHFNLGPLEAFTSVGIAAVGVCALTVLLQRQFVLPLNFPQIIMVALAIIGLIGYFLTNHSLVVASLGLVFAVAVVTWQIIQKRKTV